MALIILLFFILAMIYAVLIGSYKKRWNALPEFEPSAQSDAFASAQSDAFASAQSDAFASAQNDAFAFISVIIAARNEEQNIGALLDSLIAQHFPVDSFEVIIVDDHSTDNTWNILEQYSSAHSNIHPVSLAQYLGNEKTIAYKKRAIEIAIAQSQGTLIVTTDADCIATPRWLAVINDFYQETGAKCIAAPVYIRPGKKLLSMFQSLDFLILQGITAAAVSGKLHMMCNGANFIYEKQVFNEVNGFEGIDKIPSGDDMLLMQKIYDRYPSNVHYLKSRDSIITTEAAPGWRSFFMQRIRWASKSGHYQDKKIMYILFAVYLFNFFFLLSAGFMFYLEKGWMLWFAFLLLKILIEFPFVASVARFFGSGRLLWYFPLMQPMHILYTIIAGWLGKFGSYEWKQRRIVMDIKSSNQNIK